MSEITKLYENAGVLKECKRCLHNGSCLQQQVLSIIDSTKAEEE